MAWLWDSFEEFDDFVKPVLLQTRGESNLIQRDTSAENERRLFESVRDLSDALAALRKLGFEGGFQLPAARPNDAAGIRGLVEKAVYSGERLLLLNKRLAMSEAASGFLSQHDILDHWQRYSEGKRILMEVNRLVEDAQRLVNGHHEIVRADECFLVSDLDLPEDLESDFRLARNLFSVGFEKVGVLIASRGLEGVLRRIAEEKRLRTKPEPTLHELTTALYQARWRGRDERLITRKTRSLLDYLRTIRNQSAHSGEDPQPILSPRDTALAIARTASRLWNLIGKSDIELDTRFKKDRQPQSLGLNSK